MIDDRLREELSALLDGALPEERARELRQRIGKDPELRREYAELERAVMAVRALPRSRAPAELRARIRGSLGERPAGARIFRFGALAAAATVLLAVAVALYLRRETPARFEAAEGPARQQPPDDALVPGKEQASEAREALAPADRAQDEGKKLGTREDGAGVESQLGAAAPKEAAARGRSRAKEEKPDLLKAVEKSREVLAADRKAYLRQVAALGADKALEHVRAVIPDEDAARGERDLLLDRRDGTVPVLATIQLEDREEANLVRRILDTAPRQEAGAAVALTVEEDAKDQMSTEILGTPEDLRRLGRWLALLDLARPAASQPKVAVFDETKRADEAAPEVRTAVVRLRYGKPPEPQPEAPAKGK